MDFNLAQGEVWTLPSASDKPLRSTGMSLFRLGLAWQKVSVIQGDPRRGFGSRGISPASRGAHD